MYYVKENILRQKRANKRAATLKVKAYLIIRVRAYSLLPTTYKRNSTKLYFFNSKRAYRQELGYLIY